MELRGDNQRFYATDLTNFLGCRHLASLERLAALGRAKRPVFDDPMLKALRERGLQHERAYVEHLAKSGCRVVEIDKHASDALEKTITAMLEGADAIVQARLEHGAWGGWSDVLLRVPGQSLLGDWQYEPVETKLAKETRGATLIQLCLYADLLAEIQGAPPETLRVVVPNQNFEPEHYRFDEYRAYFRLVRRNFEVEMAKPAPDSVEAARPYPEPVPHCDICNWYGVCQARWTKDDHLSLVANIRKPQRKELVSRGVTTLAGLAQLPIPLPWKPSRGTSGALERVREQARLQLEARNTGRPTYELLPVDENHGLAALPAPSPFDMFLDLEGDRLAENGGLDYLFGFAYRNGSGPVKYDALWALSPADEKLEFERLIDAIMTSRVRDPAMHVYHYAPYEPTAMKRLMGRYATRADELDQLLRGKVFVDLYSVVRRGLRAGVDSYSIKKLEPLYGLAREVDLRQATRNRRAIEYAIAKGDAAALEADILQTVEGYNRDDCKSALELRHWLENLRTEAERINGEPVPRPTLEATEVKEELQAHLARIRDVSNALTAHLPIQRSTTEQAQWTLAQLLEWNRREDKVEYWEFHRLDELTDDDLLDEPAGVAGLEFQAKVGKTKHGLPIDRYAFPAQDTEIEEGDVIYEPGQVKRQSIGGVEAIDLEHRTIDLRKSKACADRHPTAIFKHDVINNRAAEEALLRLGEFVRDHGIDALGRHRAARDLLLRKGPRLAEGESLRKSGETTVEGARRAVIALDGGVLAIQGPPGTGKTYAGARMIVDLVRARGHVGVTACSHKVIRKLLDEVLLAATEAKVTVRCMDRVQEKSKHSTPGIYEETNVDRAVSKIRAREYDVVGGTAWVWAKEQLAQSIDVLFVDEAGQMSLANVLACAQAARNLVLLGDPQQLEQPQKAAHPDGSELSALEYLLEKGHDTIPEDRGLFLGESWRLHPSICRYTSELFYEGKLHSYPSVSAQVISGPSPFAGTGLFYVPVEHEGNQNASTEEAEQVAEIARGLVAGDKTWTSRKGEVRPIGMAEILIVAPYNAQVSEIAEHLPGARVGTVDKFQGQEAPIVIYSMATSSPEEAPHGMEFLFSRHRLNVATSRAQCVCILVANPRLFEPDCRTPEQMRMANAFCRYLELARTVQ